MPDTGQHLAFQGDVELFLGGYMKRRASAISSNPPPGEQRALKIGESQGTLSFESGSCEPPARLPTSAPST